MSTQDTASRIFLKPLTLPRDRSDSLLEDTTDDANAEHQGSHPINYPENTNGGPNVACRQSNTAAFVKNSENLVGSDDGELDVHRSLRETTGSAAAERKAFTVPEVDPVHLRTRINEIYQAHPIGLNQEGYYVPDKELRELLNKETIRGAMGEGVDDKLVHFVLEKAPKTFATLQLDFSKPKQRKQAMEAFQNRGFTDEGLIQRIWLYASHPHVHNPMNHKPTNDNSGNFSDVICVDMLAEKQTKFELSLPETIPAAHKTLRPLDVPRYDIHTEWLREAEAHRQLNGINGHLVEGIAAYRRVANSTANDTYHIVLEWADGGNLFSFWNKDTEPQLDGNTARSRERVHLLLKQLCGLAHAVESMHSMRTGTTTSSIQSTGDLSECQHGDTVVTPTDGSSAPAVNVEAPAEDSPSQARHPGPANLSPDSQDARLSPPDSAPRHHSRRASDAKNWRHGDIKPENILRFTGGDNLAWLGTLKLADLGRAQQHDLVTALRNLSEDLHQQAHGKISRLFDIWSMGCVMFESVIWLLYGSSEITRFQKIETLTAATPYWRKIRIGSYQVTERASLWMKHILKHDAKQPSAIGDVVKLVRDRLLQVDLPPDSDVYTAGKRTNAKDMREQLARILERASREPEYLFDGIDKFGSNPPPGDVSTPIRQFNTSPDYLPVPTEGRSADKPVPIGHRTRIENERVYTDSMTDIWQYPDDDHFAKRMIGQDQTPNEDDLCDHCEKIDIKSSELVFNRSSLETDCEQCAFCHLVKKAIDKVDLPHGDHIRLERDSDSFVAYGLDGSKLKILRVCCTDRETSDCQTDVPVGAPSLYNPPGEPNAADAFMRLPREWLKECDDKHREICAATNDKTQLPTRLVHLKSWQPKIIDSATIVVPPEGVRYIAFSHKWGKMPEDALTTKANLPARNKVIPKKSIPPSFADAIAITKALGCNYLWIDCLCINQGEDGDFAEQAVSMQAVFSNAYCVIAAASADGAVHGFLKRDIESHPLRAVKVGSVYFSAVTNDFSRDVLQSPLNTRGWVLQERALARRTIFFTANQMYWECGDGIRCETLRKLKHDEIAFLGDAHFPSKTIRPESTRGEQIHLWTALFKQYTGLEFSHKEDRSVGIQGLMDRLTTTFGKRSHAGLFEAFWGRCLLWHRAKDGPPLTWIPAGEHTKKLPPSWSWMAVYGPIDFLKPEGRQVEWNAGVVLPFPKQSLGSSLQPNPQPLPTANGNATGDTIRATAFNLKAGIKHTDNATLSYDDGREHIDGAVRCVIVATTMDKANHYILLISSAVHTTDATHERVGVGYSSEEFIDRASGVEVVIG
ncbi:unnamed protein product [Alternaria alternata]